MSILLNSFEGGTADAAITVGNSGGASGDAFTAASGAPLFSTAHAAHGDLAMSVDVPESSTGLVWWSFSADEVLARVYFMLSASVPLSSSFARIYGDTAATLGTIGSGRMQLYVGGDRGTSTDPLLADVWYRAEIYRTPTSTCWALYESDDTDPLYDSAEPTGLSLGSATSFRFGKLNPDADTVHRFFDSAGVKTGLMPPGAHVPTSPRSRRHCFGRWSTASSSGSVRTFGTARHS